MQEEEEEVPEPVTEKPAATEDKISTFKRPKSDSEDDRYIYFERNWRNNFTIGLMKFPSSLNQVMKIVINLFIVWALNLSKPTL